MTDPLATTESNLVIHARRELALAGLFDDDSDYDGMLGRAVLALVEVFAGQGHSGMSAAMTTDLTARLMRFENLTPLTDDPSEWENHGSGMWQSHRRSDAFSTDGGVTYYLLNDEPRVVHRSEPKETK